MKKNPKGPFTVAEAVQRANAMYAQSAAMLPGATFEEQSEVTLRHHMAWVHISDAMTRLAAQPEVKLNPVAVEFLQVIVAQVNARGFGARSAQDVLLPLEPLFPLGEIGAQRSQQVDKFSEMGSKARRIYTEADKCRWQALVADDATLQRLSKRRCAELIAQREALPAAAIETIRKAI